MNHLLALDFPVVIFSLLLQIPLPEELQCRICQHRVLYNLQILPVESMQEALMDITKWPSFLRKY